MNSWPEQFLNKQNVELKVSFQDCVDNKIVFLHILQEDLNILDNHWWLLFTVKQIDWALVSLSS